MNSKTNVWEQKGVAQHEMTPNQGRAASFMIAAKTKNVSRHTKYK